MNLNRIRSALFGLSILPGVIMTPARAAIIEATANGQIGLYPVSAYRLNTGHCTDCNAIPQALWYFQDDLLATPTQAAIGFDPALRAQEDVRHWAQQAAAVSTAELPSPLWIGSPQIATGTLSSDGSTLMIGAEQIVPFEVVPKIPANLSYYDASSIAWFAGRPLQMRGTLNSNTFVARTLWPLDFALDFSALPLTPLTPPETIETLVRKDGSKPAAPLAARVLWQKNPAAKPNWNGKPVLGIMLNGAQGDDDEAHGGHFALVTGAFGERGEWDHWLVNNFYNLGSVSEKGIIAAMLPMDAYLADLNSGQAWYRPSYLLVAVLKDPHAATQIQTALARVYNHFYRQDFVYHHATANCTGISMDTLRSLGWHIPEWGPTNALKATVALPFMALKDWSLASGEQAFDYLMAEQTNLYPFAGFTAISQDLLGRIASGKVGDSALEHQLAEDLEAILYVRIPQFPSSRVWGQAPIASLDEYMSRVPENRADWKIIPVGPRPFPAELKDPAAPGEPPLPSQVAVYAYAGVLGFGFVALTGWRLRRRQSSVRR